MYGTVVGVLRGGPSREHERSLLSGHAAVANLPRVQFTVRDIYIDKQGVWHERGKPSTPADILRTVDVVLSTLHGEYGENGEIQRLLERSGVPYVGPNSMNSYLSMHKVLSKEKAKELGFKTPRYQLVQRNADIDAATYEIVRSFQQPVVVKAVSGGSASGVEIVGGYAPVHRAISKLIADNDEVLVEEMIRGTHASVGIIEGFRDEELYMLPVVENKEFCPARFEKSTQDELAYIARSMHEALGQRHYSRSDFIVSKNGNYFIELENAVACDIGRESEFSKALSTVGILYSDFLSHVVQLALV
jgi:D-alanine-D-alanine ligase